MLAPFLVLKYLKKSRNSDVEKLFEHINIFINIVWQKCINLNIKESIF